MATVEDLLAAIKHVNVCSGDPQAWRTGLTSQEVTDVATIYVATPQRVESLLGKIRSRHPDLFDSTTGAMVVPPVHHPGSVSGPDPPADQRPTDHQEGDAADAIRSAESALAQQNSSTAQLDLQVISAILNAHLIAVNGKEALNQLQRDVESAVRTRTDLDTAAGARDFQRFLLGKLKDIRVLIAGASLDDTSKSALMAALTSLYSVSQEGHPEPTAPSAPPAVGAPAASQNDSTEPDDIETDPYLDSPLDDDDHDFFPADSPNQAPAPTPSAAVPSMPATAGFPPFGGAALPGPMPGWGASSGSSIPDLLQTLGKRSSPDDDLDAALGGRDPGFDDDLWLDDDDDDAYDEDDAGEPPGEPAGPTNVALPNGETVTAADPKLAAVIEAAVNGTPIADAFREQGITIPLPGTAVTDRIDPPQLSPGDIGMFTDHHALALGPGEALVNGQIQHISTVQGPSFLGWEHPPAPVATATPSKPDPPTPTRPAVFANA
ncbi:MAG: DUF4226 domain-containing protein [Mycobacterium sp.]|uniref:DUF4226 domain-containing protein n=1 Tax=Mycobacterium sp. TaxID=1785 RepID=UPI003CC5A458